MSSTSRSQSRCNLTPSASAETEYQASIDLPTCKSFELCLTAADRAGNRVKIAERYFHPVLADANDALLPASEPLRDETKPEPPAGLQIADKEWTAIELGTPKAASKTQLVSSGAGQTSSSKTG